MRFREFLDQYGSPKIWSFKDLIYNWKESASKRDKVNHSIFAIYSGQIAFLTLAAKIVGDTEFVGEHYPAYVEVIEEFCSTVTNAGVPNKDTDKPEVMMSFALKWAGFAEEDEFFAYVDEKLPQFSKEFLRQM